MKDILLTQVRIAEITYRAYVSSVVLLKPVLFWIVSSAWICGRYLCIDISSVTGSYAQLGLQFSQLQSFVLNQVFWRSRTENSVDWNGSR